VASRPPVFTNRCCRLVNDQLPTRSGNTRRRHKFYYWLLLAESHLTRRLFGAMVRRIEALPGCALGPAG
jgi:hypothetical protein